MAAFNLNILDPLCHNVLLRYEAKYSYDRGCCHTVPALRKAEGAAFANQNLDKIYSFFQDLLALRIKNKSMWPNSDFAHHLRWHREDGILDLEAIGLYLE